MVVLITFQTGQKSVSVTAPANAIVGQVYRFVVATEPGWPIYKEEIRDIHVGYSENVIPQGSDLVCNSNSIFTVQNLPANTGVSWTKSSNMSYVSGQNSNNYVVKAQSSSTSGSGWVQASLSGGCGSKTLPKTVWVGIPQFTGVIEGTNAAYCNNQYIYTISGGVNGSTSYTWEASNHFNKSVVGNTYYLTPIYHGEGFASVTASNSCGSATICKTICAEGCSTGLMTFPGSSPCYTSGNCGFSLMSVYPNPTESNLQLKMNFEIDDPEHASN